MDQHRVEEGSYHNILKNARENGCDCDGSEITRATNIKQPENLFLANEFTEP